MSQSMDPNLVGVDTPAIQPITSLTKPEPTTLDEEEAHYFSTIPNASFYKTDGTRLIFVSGFFSTKLKAAKAYLDKEIEEGHGYLRKATDEEVARILAARNPMAALEADFKANKEPELRKTLERDIIATLLGIPKENVTDEVIDNFTKSNSSVMQATSDANEIEKRLSVLDSLGSKNSGNEVLRSKDNFTVMTSSPSPIASTMVGTDKINDAAGSQGSGSEI